MPFYTYSDTLQSGSTARAAEVAAEFESIETGLASVEVQLDRGIKLPDGELTDHLINAAPGTRANRVVGFDSAGAVQALQTIGQWQGAWATSTAYAERDLVTEAPNNSIYLCLEAHTSGTFATDLAANKWVQIVDLTGLLVLNNQIITTADSPYAASAGDDLMCDISGGNLQVDLPANPSISDSPITITHIAGGVSVNTLTIGRNGKRIMATSENMIVDTNFASFRLMWSNDTSGWRLSNI